MAGESHGRPGAVSGIATQPLYLDVAVPRAARWEHPVPAGHAALCYMFEGRGEIGVTEAAAGRSVGPCQLADLGPGEGLAVVTGDSPVRFLLLAARPLEEPIVRHGPFVMSTRREIVQAIRDMEDGTFLS